jgi:hypothetical protein
MRSVGSITRFGADFRAADFAAGFLVDRFFGGFGIPVAHSLGLNCAVIFDDEGPHPYGIPPPKSR